MSSVLGKFEVLALSFLECLPTSWVNSGFEFPRHDGWDSVIQPRLPYIFPSCPMKELASAPSDETNRLDVRIMGRRMSTYRMDTSTSPFPSMYGAKANVPLPAFRNKSEQRFTRK